MKKIIFLLIFIILTSCGISEDCFKGNGSPITKYFPLEGFTKIKVFEGVGLIIKEGFEYEVKVVTNTTVENDLDIQVKGEYLELKDNSTCNIVRDYGQTIVYVTIPDGTNLDQIQELEIYSKTNQIIKSEGVLHAPVIRLFSIESEEGSGTGDFYFNIDNGQFVVESNTVSNFYINGNCNQMLLNFYFGNGRFYGENFEANKINVFQRGSNDMVVKPIEEITGTIFATGNVILKNNPPVINVNEVFTGKIIYN